MQNPGDAVPNEISAQTQRTTHTVHTIVSDQAPATAVNVDASDRPETPVALTPIPRGGGRFTIDRDGDRTIVTTAPLPPQMVSLARGAEQTAFGLLGLLAAIIILGPFARMFARRMERRPEIEAVGENARVLQQQLRELQQSVDAMSLEVERISESQRFQSKLLYEKKSG